MRNAEVHAPNAARRNQLRGPAAELDIGLAARFVLHADKPPGYRVPEGFTRRLFSGKCPREPFVRIAMFARVRHLLGSKYFLRKFLQLRCVESKSIHFG